MGEIKVGCLVLGSIDTNVYFLHREGEFDAIVIDPAMRGDVIFTRLREKGLFVKAILLTHGHFDHISGVNEMRDISKAKVYASIDEKKLMADPSLNLSATMAKEPYTTEADVWVEDGDEIEVGSMKCRVIAAPGHTRGSIAFYFEDDKLLFTGDSLFAGSHGRTDFPTGDEGQMMETLKKFSTMDSDIRVYPGHDNFTTIGQEYDF